MWCSKNAPKILNYDEKIIQNLTLNELQPQIVREKHPSFVERYFKRGFSDFIENNNALWIIDKDRQLIAVDLYVKPIMVNDSIMMSTHIRVKK